MDGRTATFPNHIHHNTTMTVSKYLRELAAEIKASGVTPSHEPIEVVLDLDENGEISESETVAVRVALKLDLN